MKEFLEIILLPMVEFSKQYIKHVLTVCYTTVLSKNYATLNLSS